MVFVSIVVNSIKVILSWNCHYRGLVGGLWCMITTSGGGGAIIRDWRRNPGNNEGDKK